MSGQARRAGTTGAGASARAEYDRRRRDWRLERRRRIRRGAPVVAAAALAAGAYLAWTLREYGQGGVVLGALLAAYIVAAALRSVYRRQGSITAWRTGAAGEAATARLLRRLERRGWTVLHDRAIPGSRANLDHIAVGPGGVVYVDSKNWTSKSARVTVDRGGTLWYGRHPQDRALRSAAWETEQLRAALARAGIGANPHTVIVVHGAKIPRHRLTLGGVTLIEARLLRRHLTRLPAVYTTEQAADLATTIGRLLPAYTG